MVFQIDETRQAVLDIEQELQPLYEKFAQNEEEESDIQEYEQQIREFFSRNVAFLRQYLGFVTRMEAFSRDEFAELLGVSPATVKWWELAKGLPNYSSVRALLRLTNKVLQLEQPFHYGDIYCRNIARSIIQKVPARLNGINALVQALSGMPQEERRRFITSALNNISELKRFVEEEHANSNREAPNTGP